jgi:hypothetical protein
MKKTKSINIKGTDIVLYSKEAQDFISLTDMARFKNAETTGLVISHWLSTRYTIEFMGLWEKMNNPFFNVTEFSNIKNESGSNGFERLTQLNKIAITQMESLLNSISLKNLKGK